ncbi:hypothetical protein [Cellulomonas triticagri]|uniref:Uncharacterized protein n=1 Tax=Cellulomonas triticagri TaxID=2483352 RepID=A0A3M2JNX3_9CELL|nr:hypothetical protein [Cellulomonas triticagri]RMI13323.1 hypothetical protein EBM89_04780 [Cellulomonas triticagri]
MPIHTLISGSPTEVQSVADWIGSHFTPAVAEYGTAFVSVRRTAAAEWDGDASDGFCSVASTIVDRTDEVEQAARDTTEAFSAYATALRTAQDEMSALRASVAVSGLTLSSTSILEPGRAPLVPARPPTDGSATTAQIRAYDAAVESSNAHAALVTRYNSAVDEAGAIVAAYQSALDALGSFVVKAVSWTSWVDVAVIATEETFKRYISGTRDYITNLQQTARLAEEAYLRSPGGSVEAHFQERLRAAATNQADELARHADELSAGRLARLFGGKLPVVGTIVTVAGIGYDISTGTPPSSAVVSGVAGAVAAAGTVALVSGPVGWVAAAGVLAGVAVGMGSQWMWENWVPEDFRRKVDEGIEDVWNATTGAVSDGWNALTGGVSDAWEAIF